MCRQIGAVLMKLHYTTQPIMIKSTSKVIHGEDIGYDIVRKELSSFYHLQEDFPK